MEGLGPGWSLFVGLAGPWLFLRFLLAALTTPWLSSLRENLLVLLQCPGAVCMGMVDCRAGDHLFPFLLFQGLSLLGTDLTSDFWERCQHQDDFSFIGFQESEDTLDSYLAMARHFPKLKAPKLRYAGFPGRMSESQEEIFHEGLSGLITITPTSSEYRWMCDGSFVIFLWALVSLFKKWETGKSKWEFINTLIYMYITVLSTQKTQREGPSLPFPLRLWAHKYHSSSICRLNKNLSRPHHWNQQF